MALLNVFQAGKSGLATSKAGISTAGHNIANAGTEGFSRQRAVSEAEVTQQVAGQGGPYAGRGSRLSRVERINDEYLEKQLRDGTKNLAYSEEKQVFLNQIEDVFNEMNGDGLNRLVARFFNDFRKLSTDPNNEAIRQAVRESSNAMVKDFRRLSSEMEQIRNHLDNRIDGNMKEFTVLAQELAELNNKIRIAEIQGSPANDLQDRRDVMLKKMSSFVDVSITKDNNGMVNVDIRGVGPVVTGPNFEKFHIGRAQAQPDMGSIENSLQIARSPHSTQYITDRFNNGKMGALIEVRDKSVSMVLERLDQLAYAISSAVNEIHEKGFTLDGKTGIKFFDASGGPTGMAQRISLSSHVRDSVGNIATGLQPNAPSDNRNALAIANLQNIHFMNNGRTTADDFYNSIVTDIGVTSSRNNEILTQNKSIISQLGKMREQVSGVSIDEETTNLMQFQHAYDASAKVIKTADEMLDTILSLRR
jgi:flagellar hook-associated protein 1 FlgK